MLGGPPTISTGCRATWSAPRYVARILGCDPSAFSLPLAYDGTSNEWESAVLAGGMRGGIFANTRTPTRRPSVDFLACSSAPTLLGPVVPRTRTAQMRARSAPRSRARCGTSINAMWIESKNYGTGTRSRRSSRASCAGCRSPRCATRRGLSDHPAQRHYLFSQLGIYSERADNTARILDVKYHFLLPEHELVGGPLDYFQWAAILRSVRR